MAVVLVAAILHAAWNAVVKGGGDKFVSTSAVAIGHAIPASPRSRSCPRRRARAGRSSASSALLHVGYQTFLATSYRLGDLAQVYPLARGSAPLIVALVSVTLLGVPLGGLEIAAILLIATGHPRDRRRARQAAAPARGRDRAGDRRLHRRLFAVGRHRRAALGQPRRLLSWVALFNATITSVIVAIYRPGVLRSLPRHAPARVLVRRHPPPMSPTPSSSGASRRRRSRW